MAARKKTRAREAQLAFEALSIEGGLLSPDWLSRAAQLAAGGQSEADYRIPKGLNLRDEIGRFWRIAQAHWGEWRVASGQWHGDLQSGRAATIELVSSLLREAFGFATLERTDPIVLAERSYPIGFAALGGRVPVVIAPAGSGLDTPAPAFGDGTRRRSAFGLAQEYLNAADGAMWGLASDGLTLRIVRDNASLTRPAWIEADLQRLFTEERYADFAALWLLAHETRFGRADQPVGECALETWRSAGREEGTRAREHLRRGVEDALIALGQGFLAHPDNQALRAALQSGALSTKDYFNQLLRLVYRLIFLLTVEERGVLHPPRAANGQSPVASGNAETTRYLPLATYQEGYSLRRLRERSVKRSAHDRFADLWEATKIVFRGVEGGEPRLGLPALGGIFAKAQCPALDAAKLENRALLLAVFKLSWLREDAGLARVNWRDMGPEELGSVYESLLELVPQITKDGRQFAFATGGETKGNARKTTGSYYTPDSLVQVLLDSALEPVIEEVVNGQWRVASGTFESEQEREQAHEVLSRSRGVEARHDDRRGCLPADPQLPEGGAVRIDLADPPSSGLDSGEHRRGMGPSGRQRVFPLSSHRERESARARDASPAERPSGPDDGGERSVRAGRADDPVEATAGAATQDSDLTPARIWDLTPLATGHSLLASEALLRLAIVDPACGSGHFLLAAARRLASHVARLSANGTPSAAEYRHALRQVVGRCIYGVDLNPMAVELCKVSLWMEAVEPGLPLTFLNSHIQHGNALLGTTPELMAKGIPDAAWEPIEGDDKKTASALKKRNKKAAEGQRSLDTLWSKPSDAEAQAVARAVAELEAASDANPEALAKKESQWDGILGSAEYRHQKLVADAWCAAFVWPKQLGELAEVAPTNELWRQLRDGQGQPPALTTKTVGELAEQYRFFHWNLQFPQVFAKGGFDVVLGNPPWDEVQFEETAWFAAYDSDIASAQNAAERTALIASLEFTNPTLFAEYRAARRAIDGTKQFVCSSGAYTVGTSGKLNTGTLFTTRDATLTNIHTGALGLVVPTGIATDKGASDVFANLMENGRVRSLYDFINRRLLFPAVRPHQHFCLLTVAGARIGRSEPAEFAAFLEGPNDLDVLGRRYCLTWHEIVALNPEARALPLYSSTTQANASRKLSGALTPLGLQDDDGEWAPEFQQGTFNMASASALFRTQRALEADGYELSSSGLELAKRGAPSYVPLFDAKMGRQFEWRAASLGFSGHQFRKVSKESSSVAQLSDRDFVPGFAYWVPKDEAEARLGEWQDQWLLGFKDVTGVTSTRLAAFAFIPRMGVAHVYPILRVAGGAASHGFLATWLNSLLVEWFLRQRMQGLHLTWHILSQVPVPLRSVIEGTEPWASTESVAAWAARRVAELSCTSARLAPLAGALLGREQSFAYDDERRYLLRAELDAAVFLLAGFEADAAVFVMDSLDKVAAREARDFGEYRSRKIVPEIMAAMVDAARSGGTYQTRLDPPPADARVAHPDTRPAAEKKGAR